MRDLVPASTYGHIVTKLWSTECCIIAAWALVPFVNFLHSHCQHVPCTSCIHGASSSLCSQPVPIARDEELGSHGLNMWKIKSAKKSKMT